MATQGTGDKGHSSFGNRIKGAAHVVHGIGEDIRGSVMGAVESVAGSEPAKAKDEDIVAKGRSEIEHGIAQMKGVAIQGSTTAGPESQVEGKTGDQQQQQPAKQEESGPTPAPPPPGPTQGAVRTDDPKSRQAEPETSRQEPTAQTGTENVQKSRQETQASPETKSPQTGDKGLIGEGADAPQGPGSSV